MKMFCIKEIEISNNEENRNGIEQRWNRIEMEQKWNRDYLIE